MYQQTSNLAQKGKGKGDTIVAQPVTDIIVKKTKLSESKRQGEGINCLLYEARNNVLETISSRLKNLQNSENTTYIYTCKQW